MRRPARAVGRLGAALALVCVWGCGAYAPAEWPDDEPPAAREAGAAGEEPEEPDGA